MNRRIRSSVRTWPDDQEIEAAHVFRQTDATVRRTHQRPDGDNNWRVLFRDCLYLQDRETALHRQIHATHEIVEARWATVGEILGPMREAMMRSGSTGLRYRAQLQDAVVARLIAMGQLPQPGTEA